MDNILENLTERLPVTNRAKQSTSRLKFYMRRIYIKW